MKKQSGITVVALIVSIIVMLILVSVTVVIAFRDGGLYKTAKEITNETGEQMDYEQNKLKNDINEYVDNAIQQISPGTN